MAELAPRNRPLHELKDGLPVCYFTVLQDSERFRECMHPACILVGPRLSLAHPQAQLALLCALTSSYRMLAALATLVEARPLSPALAKPFPFNGSTTTGWLAHDTHDFAALQTDGGVLTV